MASLLEGIVKISVVGVAGFVVIAAIVGGMWATGMIEFGPPSVEEINTEWGAVDEEESEIETEVVVANPNPLGVPAVFSIDYEAEMNDITVADGTQEDVGLGTGRTTVDVDMVIDNEKIPDWWISHVNRGEQTDVMFAATISGPFVSRQLPPRQRSFETDVLGQMVVEEPEQIEVGGQPVAEVSEVEASWGEADAMETPIRLSVTITNTANEPVTISDLGYDIRFNTVTMGEGIDDSAYTIEPGATRSIEFAMIIDTQQIKPWWVTHIDRDELTSVSFTTAVTVSAGGESERVTLDSLSPETTLNTSFVANE